MRGKQLVSSGMVVGLLAISVIALEDSYSSQEIRTEAKHTKIIVDSVSENIELPESLKIPKILISNKNVLKKRIRQNKTSYQRISKNDSYLLTKLAMAEAEGEDTKGKALVIMVVLNRVKSNSFPDSVEEVIYQKKQFSPIANGRFDRVEPDEDCRKALKMVMADNWDESKGALYFESESKSTWHRNNLQFLFQHGKHLFYTDKEG